MVWSLINMFPIYSFIVNSYDFCFSFFFCIQDGKILALDDIRSPHIPVNRLRIIDGGNLVINNVRQLDEGHYQCIAQNVVGSRDSTVVKLTVQGKPFSQLITKHLVLITATVQFNYDAT